MLKQDLTKWATCLNKKHLRIKILNHREAFQDIGNHTWFAIFSWNLDHYEIKGSVCARNWLFTLLLPFNLQSLVHRLIVSLHKTSVYHHEPQEWIFFCLYNNTGSHRPFYEFLRTVATNICIYCMYFFVSLCNVSPF